MMIVTTPYCDVRIAPATAERMARPSNAGMPDGRFRTSDRDARYIRKINAKIAKMWIEGHDLDGVVVGEYSREAAQK